MNKGIMVGILALILASGIYMYTSRQPAPTEEKSEDAMMQEKTMVEESHEDVAMMAEADYVLDMQNFSFAPNAIEAKAGQTLKVKIINVSGFHDFVIDEFDVASNQLAEGEEEIVEIMVPADATGEYEFYCSVGNHRAQGMFGTFMIVE